MAEPFPHNSTTSIPPDQVAAVIELALGSRWSHLLDAECINQLVDEHGQVRPGLELQVIRSWDTITGRNIDAVLISNGTRAYFFTVGVLSRGALTPAGTVNPPEGFVPVIGEVATQPKATWQSRLLATISSCEGVGTGQNGVLEMGKIRFENPNLVWKGTWNVLTAQNTRYVFEHNFPLTHAKATALGATTVRSESCPVPQYVTDAFATSNTLQGKVPNLDIPECFAYDGEALVGPLHSADAINRHFRFGTIVLTVCSVEVDIALTNLTTVKYVPQEWIAIAQAGPPASGANANPLPTATPITPTTPRIKRFRPTSDDESSSLDASTSASPTKRTRRESVGLADSSRGPSTSKKASVDEDVPMLAHEDEDEEVEEVEEAKASPKGKGKGRGGAKGGRKGK